MNLAIVCRFCEICNKDVAEFSRKCMNFQTDCLLTFSQNVNKKIGEWGAGAPRFPYWRNDDFIIFEGFCPSKVWKLITYVCVFLLSLRQMIICKRCPNRFLSVIITISAYINVFCNISCENRSFRDSVIPWFHLVRCCPGFPGMGRILRGCVQDFRGWGALCEVLSRISGDGAQLVRFCPGFPEMRRILWGSVQDFHCTTDIY